MQIRKELKPVHDLAAGTVVVLPEELDRAAGYVEGDGSSTVLVPGYNSLRGVELPECALVEVIVTPHELANAYLRGDLKRLDRRFGRPRRGPSEGHEESKNFQNTKEEVSKEESAA